MTEEELYEQDRDNRINADVTEISFDEWKKQNTEYPHTEEREFI